MLSIIVAMYNEATVIDAFFTRIFAVLQKMKVNYEVICVDDGSTDDTLSLLYQLSISNTQIKVLSFSRNFGKEIALTAGLDHALHRVCVCHVRAEITHSCAVCLHEGDVLAHFALFLEGFVSFIYVRKSKNLRFFT